MDLDLVSQLAKRWGYTIPNKELEPQPQARYITGSWRTDALVYLFEQESGLEITLSSGFGKITSCVIIDEAKFTLFLLRWT